MGREVWRMRKGFEWPLGKTWWGFTLPPIPCAVCAAAPITRGCVACEGDRRISPRVEPPGYRVDELPRWFSCAPNSAAEYGWQLWETTSEGSPLSPVCDSAEHLARWLADNRTSAFGDMTATYEEWLGMIRHGSAPSAMFGARGLESGVAAIGRKE